MRTFGKWVVRLCAGLAVLVLLALGTLYLLSERVLDREYAAEAERVMVPTDSAAIAEGRRLAAIRGCYGGCHGEGTKGGVFFDPPGVRGLLMGRLVAPDLGRLAEEWSVAELDLAIRRGIRPDGTSTLAMPSTVFQYLSDEDLGKILAFLRSREDPAGPTTSVRLGPLARFFVLRGVFEPQAATIDHDRRTPETTPAADTLAHGEYLARLMATGEPVGDRELDLMRRVSLSRFSHFTEAEVAALYAFLRERVAGGGS